MAEKPAPEKETKATKEDKEVKPVDIQPSKPSLTDQLTDILAIVKKNVSAIIIIIVVGVLGYAFITVSSILSVSEDQEYYDEQAKEGIRSSFDQKTIDKINELRDSSDKSSIDLPSGRINPFAE